MPTRTHIHLDRAEVDMLFAAMTLARQCLNTMTVAQVKAFNLDMNTAEKLDAAAEYISNKWKESYPAEQELSIEDLLKMYPQLRATSRSKKAPGMNAGAGLDNASAS